MAFEKSIHQFKSFKSELEKRFGEELVKYCHILELKKYLTKKF